MSNELTSSKKQAVNNYPRFSGEAFGSERGATAILISIFVLSSLLLGVLAASSVMVYQMKMSRQITDSIPAFFAAESGAEKCYFQIKEGDDGCAIVGEGLVINLSNGARATADRTTENQLNSFGVFNNTYRKVQLNW
ncbi:MAG: hypothetical protein UV36_C0035G0003 [Parcubacteria group bacterium GW2011_GWC2_42_6]|nr:MAG: hypothetical protein UV36_C0035G0003 [Parcubacteria group bacterium GW2011_GWC2_42_6]